MNQIDNLLIFSLNSAYKTVSGGDTCIQNMAKILAANNHNCKIVLTTTQNRINTHTFNGANSEIEYLAITDEEPTDNVIWYYIKNTFKAYFKTKQYIKNFKEQNPKAKIIVLSGSEYFPDILPLFWLKLKGSISTWVIFSHLKMLTAFERYNDVYLGKKHGFSPKMAFNWLNQWLSTSLFRFISKDKFYFAFNREIQDFLSSRKIDSVPIRYGSDTIKIQTSDKIKKVYDAVFLGRFHAQKGIEYLIPLVEILKQTKPDFKLLVIGGGDEQMEKNFKSSIIAHDLSENLICVGQKIGQEKIDLLQSSKLFLFPSTYESFGIVLMEAASCGLPAVAFKLPIFQDLFGDAILTADIGDVQSMANSILNLLDDAKLYQHQLEQSQKLLEKYSWEKTTQTLRDTLNISQSN